MPEKIVVFGGSFGAGDTLNRILPQMGRDGFERADAAAVVVNHLPWEYRPYAGTLARWTRGEFRRESPVEFREAALDEQIVTGSGLLVPYSAYSLIRHQNGLPVLKLVYHEDGDPTEIEINSLFLSASLAFGEGTTAVLLSGCGTDGVYGLRCIRDAGGKALVHDYRESNGRMNRTAIEEGLADGVFRIQDFRRCLVQYL